MLARALEDPTLSSKAIGLLFRILEQLGGRVPSADELAGMTGEGRRSILAGMAELRERGYVVTVTYPDANGYFRTTSSIVPDGVYGLVEPARTGVRFQHSLLLDSGSTQEPLVAHSDIGVLTPNGVSTQTDLTVRQHLTPEEIVDPRDLFGPASSEGEPTGFRLDDAPDPALLRRLKYGSRPGFSTKPTRASRRHDKPPGSWSLHEIAVEFVAQVHQHCPERFGQVNQGALRRHLSIWLSEGADRAVLVRGIRAFFADERNYRGAGDAHPLWLRFVAWMPRQQERLRQDALAPDDYLARSEQAAPDAQWADDLAAARQRMASGRSRL